VHASIDRVFLRLDDRPEILVSIRLARARASRGVASASAHRDAARGTPDARRSPAADDSRAMSRATTTDDAARSDVQNPPHSLVARVMSRRDDGADALEIVGQIGEGAFGRVMYARNRAGAHRASVSTASSSSTMTADRRPIARRPTTDDGTCED